jgi:putative ABC transport system permease protein
MLNRLKARLRSLFLKSQVEQELDDELQYHIERQTEQNVRLGMSPEKARDAARKAFGGVDQAKERSRNASGVSWIEEVGQDLRYGARMLLKNPGFTLIAVITLSLGIGANTAIFSVVYAVSLRPLPYKDADRLVVVWESSPARNFPQVQVNPDNFADWRDQNHVFTDMAAFSDDQISVLTGDGEPEEVASHIATPNLFPLLGVEAALGRVFTPDEGRPGQPRVVLISNSLWQRRFGGDPTVIGRKLIINRGEAMIVGVMPAGFQWSVRRGSGVPRPAELWTPYALPKDHSVWRGRFMTAIARLKPGVSLEQAQAEMTAIAARLEKQYPAYNAEFSAKVVPLRDQLYGDVRQALLMLLGAVAFVLLIVCANVANLLLGRAAIRSKEIALRSALGASRLRIVRQLLTESLLLAVVGGAAGLLLAGWGVDALVSLSPPALLNLPRVRINAQALIFTLGVSLVTSLVIGLAPAWDSSRLNLHDTLKESGRNISGGRQSRRIRGLLIITEIALALVLLVGAGLLINSFTQLQAVNPGFNPRNVLTMRVSLPWQYPERRRIEFFKQAVERLQAIPGVQAAGAITPPALPFNGPPPGTRFFIEGRPRPPAAQEPTTYVCVSDANYFRAMQIPLRRGRLFTEQEATAAHRVVLINEALARKYFPNEEPIGKQLTIQFRLPSQNPPSEIIGIVGDVKQINPESPAGPAVYWPHSEWISPVMTLVVRTQGDALNVTAAASGVIRSLDPEQPVAEVRTAESLMAKSMAQARFNTLLLAVFAAVALILASVGIYGVMAHAVTQRRHEIGIRIALGAQTGDVLKLVIGHGMRLVLVGLAIGLIGALGLTRLTKHMLFGVSATDPMTFAVIALLLTLVALLACWIPARRATKVDPLVALRNE